MGKHMKKGLSYSLLYIYAIMILLIIVCLNITKDTKIRNLERQINEIRFEQQYLEYIREDYERQIYEEGL